jgi:hypothetical protein
MNIQETLDLMLKKPEIIQRNFDFNTIRSLVNDIGRVLSPEREFKIDAENEEHIKSLILYFMGSAEFEKEKYSLYRGNCLRGNVGTGKSMLMRIFSQKGDLNFTQERNFKTVSCIKIYSDFCRNGFGTLEQYVHFNILEEKSIINTYCFDDFGEEKEPANYYGKDAINIMEYILLSRYDNWQSNYQITHLTTNLTPKQIEDKYGERVRSRISEMCNEYIFDGHDRRRIK